MADDSIRHRSRSLLNAGRGNPNWVCIPPREAFFLLGKFGIHESMISTLGNGNKEFDVSIGISGSPHIHGISQRFAKFLKENRGQPGCKLLHDVLEYMYFEKTVDPDLVVFEWTESILADQYPSPDRMLRSHEMIVHDYIVKEMCNGIPPSDGKFDLFATEGGTAAMCYIFDSLQVNHILGHGDKIALFVPVFTPYLEIPKLERYAFHVVQIRANEMAEDGWHTWQFPDDELSKLEDKSIKALMITNPSNPPSYSLSQKVINKIKDVVENINPNLMIVTDDVYGTFVPQFRSLISILPFNTLCVYSFSKYFGATGWRLAVIALHEKNVFDKIIGEINNNGDKNLNSILHDRYSSISLEPEKVKFIDRLVADSRQVALNHTAGLSLPQQMQMTLFAGYALIDKEDKYKTSVRKMLRNRRKLLHDAAEIPMRNDSLCASYYEEIDLICWGNKLYGEKFTQWLHENHSPIDPVFRLANETSLVLLNGGGFEGPKWSVRVSLANLNDDDYQKIGEGLKNIMNEYGKEWEKSMETII
ncbi:aspartate decarboxylase AsdA [Tritrichomonas foetus]|uniref:Aspartate decarboxylase AsdA n=1 Tax=Tritrichomonas foetus TaxID=1144522 RepID=A0A1J4JLR3_9EUKA|nr:aspartate decarboxylase AsdA [Tritrichomonas foetus]|eukprot:OHT00057.1 aspartate decarboxylase AsdA [Tritrichomonas foetus]